MRSTKPVRRTQRLLAALAAGLLQAWPTAGAAAPPTKAPQRPASTPIQAVRSERLSANIEACWSLPGVRAGSALLTVGDRLLAVQDDAFAVAWIDPASRQTKLQTLNSSDKALPKDQKPDFEAAVHVPGQGTYVLGSGSAPTRTRIARLDPAGRVDIRAADDLYETVAKTLGTTPNLEGAVVDGGMLRLFHRGAGGAPSVAVSLPLSALQGGPIRVLERQAYDLGRIDGVPLAITDVARLDEGRLCYLAVAEDSPNAIDDGPVVGMAIGIITAEGVAWTPLREPNGAVSRRKAEGLALDPDGHGAWLITDADDPTRPAELCRVTLQGFRKARTKP